jgi:hypothetical protein
MQSFNDLNNYSATPVNYGSSADYVISFGTNQGNLSTTEFESGYFLIYKQVPLNTFSDVSRDLLVTISTTTLNKILQPFYNGSNSNIRIWENTPQSWTITGIRSVSDYNDVFANTYVGIASNISGTADVTFLLDDQVATTQTYTATITIVPNTLFTYSTPISFAEDTLVSFGNLLITDNSIQPTNYTISLTPANSALGKIKVVGGALSNTYSFTGTKAAVNSAIGNVRFAPGADSLTNTHVDAVVTRTFDNRILAQVIQANWNGNSHSNYTIPASYSTAEETPVGLSGISITDLRPDNIDANTQYSITINSADSTKLQLEYANTYSNFVTLTGTKSNLNALLANANSRPNVISVNDFVGTSNITYTQINTTDNVNQATARPIPVTVSDSPEYSLTTNYITIMTDSGSSARFQYQILDQDILANTYSMTFTRNSGSAGNFIVNGSDLGSGPITYTANRATVNASNITFATTVANTGNVGMAWSLSKTSTGNVITTIASNVAMTLSPAVGNLSSTYAYTSNRSNFIFPAGNTRPIVNTALTGNVTLSLNNSGGYIALTDSDRACNWSYTNQVTSVNSTIPSIKFYPFLGQSGNVTATLQLVSGGITWAQRTITLVGTPGNVDPAILSNVTLTTSGNYTPQLDQALYCKADLVLIGGGGGGAVAGGGGGGGGVTVVSNQIFPEGAQSVIIGNGGNSRSEFVDTFQGLTYRWGNGLPGGNTQIFSSSAGGGQGGFHWANFVGASRNPKGGNSGAPTSFSGGNGTGYVTATNRYFYGGGGAGANQNGVAGGNITGPGAGGSGLLVVDFGTYAAGGGGFGVGNGAASKGTSTASYGNGGNACGFFLPLLPGEPGNPGAVIIKWKPR